MTVQAKNYNLLMQIAPDVLNGKADYLKLEAGSRFMPLTVEILYNFRIAMMHYYIQNGDLMHDPDMEIEINHKNQTAHAKTFQQDNMGIYQNVDNEDGYKAETLSSDLDQFLNQWLNNILNQGYTIKNENNISVEKEDMMTRSYIGRRIDSVACEVIYCHSDGYISGVGATLQEYYSSNSAVDSIIEAGYLTGLTDDIRESTKHSVKSGTSHIMRIDEIVSDDFKSVGIEYVYLWNGIFWQVYPVFSEERFLMLQPLLAKMQKGNDNEK